MTPELLIKPEVLTLLSEYYNTTINEGQVKFQKTKKEYEGDITLLVFPFAKVARKSPEQAGEEIGKLLKENIEMIADYNAVGGFLNLVIEDRFWLKRLQEISETDHYGIMNPDQGRVMVEYSSPNTNKPLHLGHLRNNFLGHSVSRILEANGHEVVKTQIINDRGIHICKSMLAWQRFGDGETPESGNIKGDKLVGKYYVLFDKALKKETEEVLEQWKSGNFDSATEEAEATYKKLSAALEGKDEKGQKGILDKIKKLANNATPIMQEVQDMLRKWEAKDPEVYALWQKMNGWVYDGFEQTYDAMQVSFDKLYYESDTYLTGKEMVEEGLKKGVFFKKDDGSVWIDLTDEGLDEKIVLRADGTAVYVTQDIGTAQQRMKDYPDLQGIVYTVGNEQDYHFSVLFLILKKLGYQWAANCYHLSYGMVDLPTGKMKSREGTVVDADDLVAEVIDTAKEMTEERGHIEGMTEEEKNNLFQTIGLGGLKYYLLKVDPAKRMLFNPAESVELNGHTGPFIQYTHARISSLLRKASEVQYDVLDATIRLEPTERELIKLLIDYPQLVKDAGSNYSPALIANYAYELSKMYNSLWQSLQILTEEEESIKKLRLSISHQVLKVIKSAMFLLGINVPERM